MNDSNNKRFLSPEMYFEILDNAWSFWLVLRQILLMRYSNVKLLSMNIPNNFSQLLLSMVEPLTFSETGHKGKRTNGILKSLLLSC